VKQYKLLTYDDRRQIERLYAQGDRIEDICFFLGVSQTCIRKELVKGRTGKLDANQRLEYSAEIGQRTTMENVRRRGRRRTVTEGEA
jgi:IS30 family transposase